MEISNVPEIKVGVTSGSNVPEIKVGVTSGSNVMYQESRLM